MPTTDACRAEIQRLHDCFVAWFTGASDGDDVAAVADALHPDFELVTPDGTRSDRASVLGSIRAAHGREEPGSFDIDIRNVEVVHRVDDHATVRYEEWQETPDGTTGRVSTALLREAADAPGGLVWLDLHETWIER
ncbi:DUF4440 domain-containing protein [Halobaculum lipolyticum]|uniref:DUF4440 domain-containing protein n=1 Tax=Halobaculum lipolyticum TaxID=3032001 RepID=A0ABD5W9J2_9EURY|nr:DUF4440 domain-containing protein [Halobaculum sp. DT31]